MCPALMVGSVVVWYSWLTVLVVVLVVACWGAVVPVSVLVVPVSVRAAPVSIPVWAVSGLAWVISVWVVSTAGVGI